MCIGYMSSTVHVRRILSHYVQAESQTPQEYIPQERSQKIQVLLLSLSAHSVLTEMSKIGFNMESSIYTVKLCNSDKKHDVATSKGGTKFATFRTVKASPG